MSVSGADKASPMEGVTGTMAGLGCVPRSSRGGLYGHEPYHFFRIVELLELNVAGREKR